MRLFSLLPLMLSACLTASSFPDQLAAASCSREEECVKVQFDSEYSSQQDCKETLTSVLDSLTACQAEHCKFNAKVASSCLKNYNSASCSELATGSAVSDCDAVYEECDLVALATCAMTMGTDTSM